MNQFLSIDLHAHTTASDGSLSPRELVELAVRSRLSALAVTDHDTVDGLPEAIEALNLHLTDDEIQSVEEPYTPHGPSWF